MNTSSTTDLPPEIDMIAVRTLLGDCLTEPPTTISAQLMFGGRSNLTYLVTDGARQWVVRRPPMGTVTRGTHDVAREFSVLQALSVTTFPVPRPLALRKDGSGVPFYAMEFIDGTVYRSDTELEAIGSDRTRLVSDRLVDTLADLHRLDPGILPDRVVARSAGFLRRQLDLWTARLADETSPASRNLAVLADKLHRHLPESGRSVVLHGDYRLDNCIFDKTDRIAAVLDWEMSTVGDPLSDLALMLAYAEAAREGIGSVGTAEGFPTTGHMVDRYAADTGRDVSPLPWYLGLSFFKLSLIACSIHQRFAQGDTLGEGFETIGLAAEPLARLGIRSLKE